MVERLAVLDRPANMLVDRAQVQRVLLREVRRVFVHARAWPKDCRTVARLEAKKQQGVVLMPNALLYGGEKNETFGPVFRHWGICSCGTMGWV
jgi:hypothetical protein